MPDIKQIVVLSHNEFFLHELTKGIAGGDKKTLGVNQNFVTGASVIEELSLNTLVERKYFKHVKELEDFPRNPDIGKKERVLGLMRNVLEANICFKFYRQTSTIPENERTFGTLITELQNQNVVFRDNSNPAAIISKLTLINGISCKPHHGEPTPNYGVLGANPDTISTTELANLVADTLDLIDNRL